MQSIAHTVDNHAVEIGCVELWLLVWIAEDANLVMPCGVLLQLGLEFC